MLIVSFFTPVTPLPPHLLHPQSVQAIQSPTDVPIAMPPRWKSVWAMIWCGGVFGYFGISLWVPFDRGRAPAFICATWHDFWADDMLTAYCGSCAGDDLSQFTLNRSYYFRGILKRWRGLRLSLFAEFIWHFKTLLDHFVLFVMRVLFSAQGWGHPKGNGCDFTAMILCSHSWWLFIYHSTFICILKYITIYIW